MTTPAKVRLVITIACFAWVILGLASLVYPALLVPFILASLCEHTGLAIILCNRSVTKEAVQRDETIENISLKKNLNGLTHNLVALFANLEANPKWKFDNELSDLVDTYRRATGIFKKPHKVSSPK